MSCFVCGFRVPVCLANDVGVGRTRFDRLFLIGQTSQTLCVDALKAATAEAKTGKDVQRYRDAVSCLRAVAPSDPEADLDLDWIANTEAANKAQTARLETELKVYKNNLIKESIRVSHPTIMAHKSIRRFLGTLVSSKSDF